MVPVSPPGSFERGESCVFFERAIFDQFRSSTPPALRFFAVSRFLVPTRSGDLELTGTKKCFPKRVHRESRLKVGHSTRVTSGINLKETELIDILLRDV